MKISMSIVTYNSADEIESVLDSLIKSNLSDVDLKVYVVDNNSTGNTVAIVKEKYPKVVLIENGKNLGFGAAHNVAIKMVDSEYHIIVNPDITFMENTLQDLIVYVGKNPDAVIVTPKILNNNEELSEQFLPKKNPKIKYLFGGIFENKSKMCKKWRREYTMQDRKNTEPCEIDFCTGCFMFCRTEALKKVGGFDEEYFLYFEDADLTRKMQSVGKTMFVPSIRVIHGWQRENHKNAKAASTMIKSYSVYFRKWKMGVGKK